ncbi:FAD-binding oxidoreductase [Nioella aestuarii]|uniref:FAD-binding oxidoreductase n=1 Tax=Nioella aestuarii TaxID=1662864 RepID=UPI003D7FDD3E
MKRETHPFQRANEGRFPSGTFVAAEDFAPFLRDWTGRELGQPVAVARPVSTAEVAELVRIAGETSLPVVAAGGRTGLNRGTDGAGALVISLDRMTDTRDVAEDSTSATVSAGVTVAALRKLAINIGARFPLSFGAEGSSQIGGALSTNAGGSSALRFGSARQLCLGIEVVLPDGRILSALSPLQKDNTGLDLKHLFIGAEGTLGIITAATMRLVPAEDERACSVVSVPDIGRATHLLRRLKSGCSVGLDAVEFMSQSFVRRAAALTRAPLKDHADVVLVELSLPTGSMGRASDILERLLGAAMEAGEITDAVIARSEADRADFWALRERAAEVAVATQPALMIDVSLPTAGLEKFSMQAGALIRRLDERAEWMTTGHLGDGNLHLTVWPGDKSPEHNAAFKSEIEALAVSLGGSFSAEHGIGFDKLDAMRRFKDDVELDVMRRIKLALDPENMMNPGRVYPDLTLTEETLKGKT